MAETGKPRLLELFSGAGGSGVGYDRAGFGVMGVDHVAQPRYPFEFIQADALDFLRVVIDRGHFYGMGEWRFDAIHASPPCQHYSKAQRLRGNDHPDLIGPTRELCEASGLPYVIENVERAKRWLHDPVMLCGTMFGLPLYRHRLFECSFPVTPPLHGEHWLKQVKMGRSPTGDEIHQPVGHFSGVERARRDMEMPWADQDGIREAVPPAYTAFLGRLLMAEIKAKAVAHG